MGLVKVAGDRSGERIMLLPAGKYYELIYEIISMDSPYLHWSSCGCCYGTVKKININ